MIYEFQSPLEIPGNYNDNLKLFSCVRDSITLHVQVIIQEVLFKDFQRKAVPF